MELLRPSLGNKIERLKTERILTEGENQSQHYRSITKVKENEEFLQWCLDSTKNRNEQNNLTSSTLNYKEDYGIGTFHIGTAQNI